MRYVYPVVLDPEPDGSAVNVSFPDVPEALTWGDDEAEALELAQDCLVTALYGCYLRSGSRCRNLGRSEGGRMIPVPPLVAAKLALYAAMRERG